MDRHFAPSCYGLRIFDSDHAIANFGNRQNFAEGFDTPDLEDARALLVTLAELTTTLIGSGPVTVKKPPRLKFKSDRALLEHAAICRPRLRNRARRYTCWRAAHRGHVRRGAVAEIVEKQVRSIKSPILTSPSALRGRLCCNRSVDDIARRRTARRCIGWFPCASSAGSGGDVSLLWVISTPARCGVVRQLYHQHRKDLTAIGSAGSCHKRTEALPNPERLGARSRVR